MEEKTPSKEEFDDEDEIKVKIFELSNSSLKKLGELLTNETSRDIIMTLGTHQMYLNQLAQELKLRVPLVVHHLKKIAELGLLEIEVKPISKKTKDHNHFKINTDVFLPFTKSEGNKLKRIFKEGVKFASIGIVAFISWWIFPSTKNYQSDFSVDNYIISESSIPFLIIIIGLIIVLLIEKKKKMV